MHEGPLIITHISKNECADLSNPKLTMNITGVDLSDADLSGGDDFWTWYGDFKSSSALVPPVFNYTFTIDFVAEEETYYPLPTFNTCCVS